LGFSFRGDTPGAQAKYEYKSANAVDRQFKAKGTAPAIGSILTEADAGITFNFSKKDAIYFLATDCAITRIADQEPLRDAILDAYNASRWERDYVVVTELVAVSGMTIITSEGSNGKYELKAKAGIEPAIENLNVEGNFSLQHDSQIGFNLLAQQNMTPLFRCMGIKGIFRDTVGTRATIVDGAPLPTAGVSEVDYEDYEDGTPPAAI
jgi:hypothetical protein